MYEIEIVKDGVVSKVIVDKLPRGQEQEILTNILTKDSNIQQVVRK